MASAGCSRSSGLIQRMRRLSVSNGRLSMRWLLGAVTATVVSLSAGAASAAEVFKVGLIADFTGAFATWGTQFSQAIEAYQAVHGKTVKGPDGKEVEIQFVSRDVTSAGPDKAKQLAEELVLRE